MAKQLYIGTSGWSYPKGDGSWNGIFYPKVKRGEKLDELKYYAERFNAVEVNSTFYRPTSEPIAKSWAQRTPKDFKFCIKLYQKFTHPKMYQETAKVGDVFKLRPDQKDVDYFKQSIEPLIKAEKFGCLLIQFPPSFHAEEENVGYLKKLLDQFGDYQPMVELRHRSWSDQNQVGDNNYYRLLIENKASEVQIDEPKFYSSIQQSQPSVVPGQKSNSQQVKFQCQTKAKLRAQKAILRSFACFNPIVYYRFHGRNKKDWWAQDAGEQRYNYLYSQEELKPYIEEIKKQSKKKTAYVFFNNHFKAKAVANAVMLRRYLGAKETGEFEPSLFREYPEMGK